MPARGSHSGKARGALAPALVAAAAGLVGAVIGVIGSTIAVDRQARNERAAAVRDELKAACVAAIRVFTDATRHLVSAREAAGDLTTFPGAVAEIEATGDRGPSPRQQNGADSAEIADTEGC